MPVRRVKRKAETKAVKAAQSEYIVFISYSTPDSWIAYVKNVADSVSISASYKGREWAQVVAQRVKEAGVSVTSEVTLSAGSEYEKIIMEQLKNADEIIVILSGNSVDNLWMMFEIGAASS